MNNKKFGKNNFNQRGNSGNIINLLQKEGNLIVRKTIKNPRQRDFLSIEKQINFNKFYTSKSIYSCDIEKVTSQPLTFDMKYIFGFVGERIIKELNPYSIRALARNINEYLENIFEKSDIEKLKIDIFIEKLEEIKIITEDKRLKLEIEKIIYDVKLDFDENHIEIPTGFCHGDLTFSNMIISENGDLCLIDFLHTFCESPLQDYAKLIQELKYGWSMRYESKYSKTKAKIAYKEIKSNLKILKTIENKWPKQCRLFEILCLSRIAPYCDNAIVIKWLSDSIGFALNR